MPVDFVQSQDGQATGAWQGYTNTGILQSTLVSIYNIHSIQGWSWRSLGWCRLGATAAGPAVNYRAVRVWEDLCPAGPALRSVCPVIPGAAAVHQLQHNGHSSAGGWAWNTSCFLMHKHTFMIQLLRYECCPGRLTWLVYIIGAVIGGRVSFASTDEQDAMDGELVCRWGIGIVGC